MDTDARTPTECLHLSPHSKSFEVMNIYECFPCNNTDLNVCTIMLRIPVLKTSAAGVALSTLVDIMLLARDIWIEWRLFKKKLISREEFKFFLKHRMLRFGGTVTFNVGITIGIAALAATGR